MNMILWTMESPKRLPISSIMLIADFWTIGALQLNTVVLSHTTHSKELRPLFVGEKTDINIAFARLAASPDGYNADLDYIMAITPNLETLWLDTIKFATVLSEEPPTICWPELRRVCIGDGVEFALGKSFPRLTQNIEELDVHGTKNLCFVLSQALPASDSTESATQRVQMFDGTSVTRSVEMPVYDFPKLTSVVLKGKRKFSLSFFGV